MFRYRSIICIVVAAIASRAWAAREPSAAAVPQTAPAPQPRPRMGINLAGPADWNTELPFVDVFRMSRPWVSQQKGKPWGKGPPLALDERGWVKRLEEGCWAETPLCTIEGGHYPAGEYTVLYEGRGTIEFANAAVVSSAPGKMIIAPNPAKGGFFLRLTRTDPDDYVRNIRVIMPGFADTWRENPFHPAFLKRWKGMACLRFMDWMHTNGSKISRWTDRPTPDDATFSAKGVALEVMIDLCNRLKADAWFCMPHLADDEYVRNFAAMVKEKLDPGLKVWIEYSNEVWNSQFVQTRWTWEKARELGLGPAERPWEGGGMFYARRSVEIFRIWQQVFGDRRRLMRVLAWQSGNTWWMRRIVLPHNDAGRNADALAIAPYISCNVPPQGRELSAATVEKWTVDQALDYLEQQSLPRSIRHMRDTKEVADEYGLLLVAYEAGQHMVGVGGGHDNDAMTRLFHAANAHPRMGQIYDRYFEAWAQAGGDLMCYFSSVGRWSKWGSWGALQYYDDDPAKSPKFQAIIRWASKWGQSVEP